MGTCTSNNKHPIQSHQNSFNKDIIESKSLEKEKNENNESQISTHRKNDNILSGFNKGIDRNIFKKDDESPQNVVNFNFELVGKGVGNPLENYSMEKPLFESSAGAIWLTKHKLTQTLRTMKIINKENNNEENEKKILSQINTIKTIDHPNIVKVFEFYNEKDRLYIIQEHGEGGELLDYIIENSPIDELSSAYIIYQILCAVYYGHNRNIFHLDLKPENVIIDYMSQGLVHVKVMDFGSNIVQNQITKNKASMPMSSVYFSPPEAFDGTYSSYSDLWSIGVMLYLLLSARVPFMGDKESEVKFKIIRGTFDLRDYPWNKTTKEAKDLIRRLIVKKPEDRITLKQAIDHPWFKKLGLKEKINYVEKDILLKQITNLTEYNFKQTLQDAVLSFLIHNSLHLPQMRDSCKMFNMIDTGNDGVITIDELTVGIMEILQFSSEESLQLAEDIMKNVDNKQKGYIEFEEFVKACVDKERLLGEDILRYAFNYFDKDKSGDITVEELKQAFFGERNSDKEDYLLIEKMMKEVDEDGNGEIDFSEFVKIMRSIINKDD